MDSNTHSTQPPGLTGPPASPVPPASPGLPQGSTGLGFLTAADEALAAEDLDRLSDAALAEELLALGQLVDRLGGQWLRRLAVVDARGTAGADRGAVAASTAGWLRDGGGWGPGRPVRRSGRSGVVRPAPCPTGRRRRRTGGWSRRRSGWIRRGYAKPSGICWRSLTPRAPTPPA